MINLASSFAINGKILKPAIIDQSIKPRECTLNNLANGPIDTIATCKTTPNKIE